jgi:hypothetical protein
MIKNKASVSGVCSPHKLGSQRTIKIPAIQHNCFQLARGFHNMDLFPE